MTDLLKGKVAIVTGAATGIGREIAFHFARNGAAVAVDYVEKSDKANVVVAEIEKSGGRAIAVQADVSKPDQVQNLFAKTVATYGRMDILVNNAGIEKEVPFWEVPFELWNNVIAVDLTGPFLCAQAAAKQMISQGDGGRIINISSVHEDMPMPGAIDTPLDKPTKDDPKKMKTLLGEIPLNRMGQPEEVAELALFLASKAADYITGSTYFIDGGMLRQSGSL
jgi:glucose 1-dehydrogenase